MPVPKKGAVPSSPSDMLAFAQKREDEAKAAFKKYDKDNSNSIDSSEVLCLMKDMGLDTLLKTDEKTFLASYFEKYDQNNDGVLNFEEFKGFYNAAIDDSNGKGGGGGAPSAGAKKKAELAAQQAAVKNGTAPDPNGGFSAADDDTVTGLSRLLNEKLSPKEQKEWFKIFGSIDADGSGRITQEEFMRYVRKIPVKKKMMPDDVLKMVWVAIGGDAGGLKSDKFGPFMKKGQGDAGPGWKEKLAQKKASEGAAARADMAARVGRDLNKKFAGIEAATEAEVAELSAKVWKGLDQLPTHMRDPFKMFSTMDEDKSGRVQFGELESCAARNHRAIRRAITARNSGATARNALTRLSSLHLGRYCRTQLKMNKKSVPDEKLAALWLNIDGDRSGFLDAQDWGEFMRAGAPEEGPTWQERLQAAKDAEGQAARDDMDKRVGRDMNKKFAGIAAASPAAVLDLSKMINAEMGTQPKHLRDWFRMFQKMDEDGSGRIQFPEVEDMVRQILRLPKAAVSEADLAAVWLALDDDKSGFITAKEFGPFMKLGADDPGPTWKERLQDSQDAKGQAARKEMDQHVGRDMNEKFAGIDAASDDEATALSVIINGCLNDQPEHMRDWFKMFSAIDADGSGRISFLELQSMVRLKLKVGKKKISDTELAALWLNLDQDRSGFLDANDFGDFMRKGAPEQGETWKEKLQKQRSEEKKAEDAKMDALVGRNLNAAFADVEPAPAEEVEALSVLCNEALLAAPGTNDWFKCFGKIDKDGSGRVSYDEVCGFIRIELEIGSGDVTELELMALWLALDLDRSGFLDAQDFGAFMKKGRK